MTESNTAALESVYLTEEQAAALLGLTAVALRVSRHRGRLMGTTPPPWVKMGRCVRYRRAVVLAWAEAVAIEHQVEGADDER